MKKIFVTGAEGMLGSDLVHILAESGCDVIRSDIGDLDITKQDLVYKRFAEIKPDIIIHAAAYTDVDGAESEEDLCFAINRDGTRNVAHSAQQIDADLIYLSTDYVFDGTKHEPYVESDVTNSLGVYGRSKLAGEEEIRALCARHKICRSSWLFGAHGKNFVRTILRLAEERSEISVVDDQFGSPTYVVDLSRQLAKLVEINEAGIFHVTNTGVCSWFDFAKEIVNQSGVECEVKRMTSDELRRPAPRPARSVLENKRLKELGIHSMPHWKDALKRFLRSTM